MQPSTLHSEDWDLQATLAQTTASPKMPATTAPASVRVLEVLGGEEDETPTYVVSTRNLISKKRKAKRTSMSNQEHNPCDAAYINELNAVEEEPNPKRAAQLMEVVEDMEE